MSARKNASSKKMPASVDNMPFADHDSLCQYVLQSAKQRNNEKFDGETTMRPAIKLHVPGMEKHDRLVVP